MTESKHYYNMPIVGGNFEPQDDGGLVIRNVIAMATGKWTSMQGVTAIFTDEVLKREAENWMTKGIWSRHPGGSPRNINEQVGVITLPRFEEGKGVVVDMHLHGRSGVSKDVINMVQYPADMGGIKDVSAETVLKIDPKGNVQNITFTGLAIVEVGACETCKIPAFAAGEGGKDMAEGDPAALGGEGKDTLVSVARDIFRAFDYPDIADLLDLAVNLDGDEKAMTEIVGKLKEKVKAKEPAEAEVPSMDQALAPFMKKLDEVLAFAKKQDEANVTFGKAMGEVKATIAAFGNTPLPKSKSAAFSHSEDPVVYDENRPQIVRRQ